MLKKSELSTIVQCAFLPLECVAELQNYEHSFGFAVYLPDGSRIKHEEQNATCLQHESTLSSVITTIRSQIESKGITLANWSFPEQQ